MHINVLIAYTCTILDDISSHASVDKYRICVHAAAAGEHYWTYRVFALSPIVVGLCLCDLCE